MFKLRFNTAAIAWHIEIITKRLSRFEHHLVDINIQPLDKSFRILIKTLEWTISNFALMNSVGPNNQWPNETESIH